MDRHNLFPRLRESLIDYKRREKRSILYIADKTGIDYHRLWRFFKGYSDLALLDADTLHFFLTGRTLIAPDHV